MTAKFIIEHIYKLKDFIWNNFFYMFIQFILIIILPLY